MSRLAVNAFCLVLSLLPLHAASQMTQVAQEEDNQGITASAKKVADTVVVDVSLLVDATPREAWNVLVDYDRMPQFLPNLQSSKILSKSPKTLRVAQRGGATRGPITIGFDVIRDVNLTPYEKIESHIVAGNLKKVDGTTRLVAEGNATRITYHSESIPNVWVPPGIGPALIAREARSQFNDMRKEIMRRKEASR